jgi:hypothetical protein
MSCQARGRNCLTEKVISYIAIISFVDDVERLSTLLSWMRDRPTNIVLPSAPTTPLAFYNLTNSILRDIRIETIAGD